jgi:hypothetical protein
MATSGSWAHRRSHFRGHMGHGKGSNASKRNDAFNLVHRPLAFSLLRTSVHGRASSRRCGLPYALRPTKHSAPSAAAPRFDLRLPAPAKAPMRQKRRRDAPAAVSTVGAAAAPPTRDPGPPGGAQGVKCAPWPAAEPGTRQHSPPHSPTLPYFRRDPACGLGPPARDRRRGSRAALAQSASEGGCPCFRCRERDVRPSWRRYGRAGRARTPTETAGDVGALPRAPPHTAVVRLRAHTPSVRAPRGP